MRLDDTIHHEINRNEHAKIAADEPTQTRSSGTPKFTSVSGSNDRNIAPNDSENRMRKRYFWISLSGPEPLRNATTSPLKPARPMLISAIVCNESGIIF